MRKIVAIGMPVTQHKPLRSIREELPHTALTSSLWKKAGIGKK